jgi:cytochrome c oxidase cbb3-type subunit 3
MSSRSVSALAPRAARAAAVSASLPLALALAAALALVGCEREERNYPPAPAAAARGQTISLSALQAGGQSAPVAAPNGYEDSAYAVAEGKRLYQWYNCNGCHANGGGGSGPPLMDDQWIYGSAPANIVATILEGRPNGMPSFRGKIPDYQAMQLAAYVRSMSGLLAKDVAPTRSDHLRAKEPEASTERLARKDSSLPPSTQGSQ